MLGRLGELGLHVFAVGCFLEHSALLARTFFARLELRVIRQWRRKIHQFGHRSEANMGLSHVGVRTRQTCATVSWRLSAHRQSGWGERQSGMDEPGSAGEKA
jgi:hypothetical protein